MPWSNQSGGGWKGGGGGPWGQGPRQTGKGPYPPDLEELLRRSQDSLKRVLPGGGGGTNPFAIGAVILVAAALIGYNFFTFRVDADELGVVLRFGKIDREAPPGLNFRLPYPIETVYTPKVTRVNRVTVGQTQDERNPSSTGRNIPEESLMLTGDENIVDTDFSVFWVINDATKYLFNVQDAERTVKAVAEGAMREIVGRSTIQPLLTGARQNVERDVHTLMQQTLDRYGAGVMITQVQLLKVDPPEQVISSFRDVQAARADQERVQNEAHTYSNRVIPEARGQASQIGQAAEAYRGRIVAEAQGQAARFDSIYDSYRAAPDVTRRRIYLETMEVILNNTDKVILDDKAGGISAVPYLPLPGLPGFAAQPPAAQPAQPPRPPQPSATIGSRP